MCKTFGVHTTGVVLVVVDEIGNVGEGVLLRQIELVLAVLLDVVVPCHALRSAILGEDNKGRGDQKGAIQQLR